MNHLTMFGNWQTWLDLTIIWAMVLTLSELLWHIFGGGDR